MPPRSKKRQLLLWLEQNRRLEQNRPTQIAEEEFTQLQRALAISESYLRSLLRESGIPLSPMVNGVRQRSLDELESSLLALTHEYQQGGRTRQKEVRRLVITAKDHARLALRRLAPDKTDKIDKTGTTDNPRPGQIPSRETSPSEPIGRALKQETILWLTTWLENPPLFPEWVRLRRSAKSPPA